MDPSTNGRKTLLRWFDTKDRRPFPFQEQTWDAIASGRNGFLLAPTGSGKTLALFGAFLISQLDKKGFKSGKEDRSAKKEPLTSLSLIWVTPLRALAKDLEKNMQEAAAELGLKVRIERRTGDVSASQRQHQTKKMPEVLITTPESLHILFAQKEYATHFDALRLIVMDEWHEFLGSKRGTQAELALARLRMISPKALVWGISATIGNVDEAKEVLFGDDKLASKAVTIQATHKKDIQLTSIIPDKIDEFPWHGHLGLHLLPKLLPHLDPPGSVLIFTNTRAQSEIWFRAILEARPELAGEIALHHGSLTREIRMWVEDALRDGTLRVVVCTSSLDLGVDFSPVDRVVQIGSPKGIARCLQRAGRSGHAPGQSSHLYFLPTHALELIEASALRTAIQRGELEERYAVLKPFDVLAQYLVTLAVSDGFDEEKLYQEIRQTWAYSTVTPREWQQLLTFLTNGGPSLTRYSEYSKIERDENGLYRVLDRKIARRHRLSIGTIESDAMLRVKFLTGGALGSVEEWFIARLEPGDSFWFAGRNLELVRVNQNTVFVKKTQKPATVIPTWLGGRMSFSSNLSSGLREKIRLAALAEEGRNGFLEEQKENENRKDSLRKGKNENEIGIPIEPELETLQPIFEIQKRWSLLPNEHQFLVETSRSREGYHTFFFPFEGRNVHEGLSALVATRLAVLKPITFTIAMNDYGFELLSDQEIQWSESLLRGLFSKEHLERDLLKSVNMAELAKRRFRGISRVAGLVFQGFPGRSKSDRHLQMSSSLFYDVFNEIEPNHILLKQSYDEVIQYQLEETRIRMALDRIQHQDIVIRPTHKFSPFAFPIFVDRLRERVSSEKLVDRIRKIQSQVASEFTKAVRRDS